MKRTLPLILLQGDQSSRPESSRRSWQHWIQAAPILRFATRRQEDRDRMTVLRQARPAESRLHCFPVFSSKDILLQEYVFLNNNQMNPRKLETYLFSNRSQSNVWSHRSTTTRSGHLSGYISQVCQSRIIPP